MISHYALTKKTFLAGAQCLKRMWWEMYDPSAPEMRPTLTSRFRMEEGARVGMIARTYVPGGKLIKRGGRSLNAILEESRQAVADDSVPAIYESAILATNTLVFPDILERVDDGFVLIEVKSKTSVSELKHIPDLAIQAHRFMHVITAPVAFFATVETQLIIGRPARMMHCAPEIIILTTN